MAGFPRHLPFSLRFITVKVSLLKVTPGNERRESAASKHLLTCCNPFPGQFSVGGMGYLTTKEGRLGSHSYEALWCSVRFFLLTELRTCEFTPQVLCLHSLKTYLANKVLLLCAPLGQFQVFTLCLSKQRDALAITK